MFLPASLILGSWLFAASDAPLLTVPDPHAALRPETGEERKARHARVARARSGTILLLHRGAWEFAPENTLSAIRAAFELGADGVELDFHKTRDGVIVLFHDDRLERLLDGVGTVEDALYEELLLYSFTSPIDSAAPADRVPTLREVLQVVRDHAGLLHLDIKKPGMDAMLLSELRQADMLDHVVTYNDYNSEAFKEAGVTLLPFKGSLMDEGRDTDPRVARSLLERPGRMAIVDDPRAILTILGRPPTRVSAHPLEPRDVRPPASLEPLEEVLRGTSSQLPARLAAVRLAILAPARFTRIAPESCRSSSREVRRAVAWNLGMVAKHRPALVSDGVREAMLHLLGDQDIAVRAEAAVACGRAGIGAALPRLVELLASRPAGLERWIDDESRLRERQQIIEARARYAFALGLLGSRSRAVDEVLVDALKHPSIHGDPSLMALDGALAAMALGRLEAAAAVKALEEALAGDGPTREVTDPTSASPETPSPARGWWSYRLRMFALPALAEIGTDEALSTLKAIVDTPPEPYASYARSIAADALARFRTADRVPIVAELLRHDAPGARRAAILACLRHADPRYRSLLETAAPWAVPWWDVQHRQGGPVPR